MNEHLTRKSEQLAELLTDTKVRRAFRTAMKEAKLMARSAGNLQKADLLTDDDADYFLGALAGLCEEQLDPLGIDVGYEGEIFLEAITDEFLAAVDRIVFGSRQTYKWVAI